MNHRPCESEDPGLTLLTRRKFLRLGAGAALALGLAPGCARFRDSGRGDDFTFVVMNDAHFQSPKCPEFFQRVRDRIASHTPKPEFCLMAGDLAERGTEKELGGMRDVLRSLGMPFHTVLGNHDYLGNTDRSAYDRLFPRQINYHFEHRGWRFIGLDSSEGTKYEKTSIQPHTLSWLDDHLPRLSRRQPTVVFTHFPLGPDTRYRPGNADALLERFLEINLVAVFSGHFHGFTERKLRDAAFTTNKCCSISRGNHDGTKEKGYFLCSTRAGQIERQFIEIAAA